MIITCIIDKDVCLFSRGRFAPLRSQLPAPSRCTRDCIPEKSLTNVKYVTEHSPDGTRCIPTCIYTKVYRMVLLLMLMMYGGGDVCHE